MSRRYGLLVVGGGPAGLSAARAFRQADRERPVAIVSDEGRMPYDRPPLTKELLRGEIGREELPIESEDWLDEHDVSLITGRAVAIDADGRTVTLSGARELAYEHCLIATGAEPTRLPVPGSDHTRVRVVRTLDDVDELMRRIGEDADVAVIGSGFIGCEIASSLRARGHQVDLVSDEPSPNRARLGDDAATEIAEWLRDAGVRLHLGAAVQRIESARGAAVVVAGDLRLGAGVVVMAAGVAPRGELATQAGIRLEGGAIPVDTRMRTSVVGVLAAGDAACAENVTAGRRLRVEHWGDAIGQGEVAGRTAAGVDAQWDAVPGFWSTIGSQTLKYAAWGDGFDVSRTTRHAGGGFTVWYGRAGATVGVLTYDADDDYERGRKLVACAAPLPS